MLLRQRPRPPQEVGCDVLAPVVGNGEKGGDLVAPLLEHPFQRRRVAVGHARDERVERFRHAGDVRGDDGGCGSRAAREPVAVAVVAGRDEVVAPGEGPRQPHDGAVGVVACLHEVDLLQRRHRTDEALGDLQLDGRGHAEEDTSLHLLTDGGLDLRAFVSKEDRPERRAVVDVPRALGRPQAAAVGAVEKGRHHVRQRLDGPLRVRLGAPGHQVEGSVGKRVGVHGKRACSRGVSRPGFPGGPIA